MGNPVVIVLVVLLLVAGIVLDLDAWTGHNGTAAYGAALGLTGLSSPLRVVLLTGGVALLIDLIEGIFGVRPLDRQVFSFLGIASIAGLAILLTRKHHQAAAHARGAGRSLAQLSGSLRLIEGVVESTGNGILAYDQGQIVRVLNRPLAAWLGLDPAAIIGRPIEEVVRNDIAPELAQPARLMERLEQARTQPSLIIDEEYEQMTPAHRFLRVYGGPIYQEEGALAGRIIVVTDLTEERQREAKRERLGRIAQALVHEPSLTQIGVTITDEARQLLAVGFAGLWLTEPERHGFHLVAQRGLPTEATATLDEIPLALAEAIWSKRTFEVEDAQALSTSFEGLRSWALRYDLRCICAHPLLLRGQLVGMLEFGKSSTCAFTEAEHGLVSALCGLSAAAIANAQLYSESIRRAHEATEAQAHLQRFLGMVSHDLRGPVSVMLGYTQLLLRRQREADREALQAMEDAARRMRRLIDDLLIAARIGSGRFSVQAGPMDLVIVAQRVLDQQQAAAPDHHFVFQAPSHLEGRWDAERISQLLTNLISNAVKYSPPGGEVRVEITRQNGAARINVADQGIGIAPEAIGRLFQPFTRATPGQTIAGSGLGLYIARGIVEAHHGQIGVESTLGKGSTFWVLLPLQ